MNITKPDLEGPVRYPFVFVDLVGEDGNAFAVLGRVTKQLKRGFVSPEEVDAFQREAMSGDYNHLLATCTKWANCN